jgi:parvulin-like peptidyl-prolyl isomerase
MSIISKMRRLNRSIFIIVAIVFIGGFLLGSLWEILGRTSGKKMLDKGIVGKVGNKKITLNEYNNIQQYFSVKYQTENKIRDLSPQDLEQITQQTWQYLTQEKSWSDVFKKGNIKITDAEIIEIIKSNPPQNIRDNPEFKTADGNFDYEKYQNYFFADENRLALTLYARELADGLPREKFRIDVVNSYRVTQGELNEALNKENTSIKLTYLYFGPKVLQERYTPSEADLKEYYKKHQDKYEQKTSYKVRYIFFNQTITQRDSLDAKQQIDDAYTYAKAEEFGNLIREFSDAPSDSVARWVKIKDLDSITRSAIRSLKNDSVTPPFLTFTGWQFVRVDKQTKDSLLIRKITKAIKLTRETEYALRDSMKNFLSRNESTNFDTLCQEYGVIPREMPPMPKERINFPVLYNQNQLKDFVLGSKAKTVSQPLKGRAGYYIFQLISIEPKKIQPFDQAKTSIEWAIRREKEKELIRSYVETFSDKIKSRMPLEEIARFDTLIELHTEDFNSYKECRNRKGSEFAGSAYALNPGETYGILFTEIGAFVIRCDDRKNNSLVTPETYTEQRRNEVGNRVFQDATKSPEITDYRDVNFF